MSNQQDFEIQEADGALRLDRWFKRYYPAMPHGELQKLCRKGLVRIDGKKALPASQVVPSQVITVKFVDLEPYKRVQVRPETSAREQEETRSWELFRSRDVLIINKPAGIAVQGGSKLNDHIDGRLDALRADCEARPRLVHRLDKDTSGILMLARNVTAAHWLSKALRNKEVEKIYWALCVGVPDIRSGEIEGRLVKTSGDYEKMEVSEEEGKAAITAYRVLEVLGDRLCLIELQPLTGRTHQLRVHMAEFGHPILGDGKYGGKEAFIDGLGLPKKLHLHARSVALTTPLGQKVSAVAPLPTHMQKSFSLLGIHKK